MKPGDKVWVFNAGTQEIDAGVCIDILGGPKRYYVTIGFTMPSGAVITNGGYVLNYDCFPTREALCEHYRKIFE